MSGNRAPKPTTGSQLHVEGSPPCFPILLLFHFRGAHLHVSVSVGVTSIVVLFHARRAQFHVPVPVRTSGQPSRHISPKSRDVLPLEAEFLSSTTSGGARCCSPDASILHRCCSLAAKVLRRLDPSSRLAPRSQRRPDPSPHDHLAVSPSRAVEAHPWGYLT